jgi:hypothetical protein
MPQALDPESVEVTICGRKYGFCEVDPDSIELRMEGDLAICDSHTGTIIYQSGLVDDALKSIIFHELVHAADEATGTTANQLTEDQIQRIAAVLFGALRSAPDLTAWLVTEE